MTNKNNNPLDRKTKAGESPASFNLDKHILCNCGHPLSYHSTGAGACYGNLRKKERRKDETGKYVIVPCCYVCYCAKFEKRKTEVCNAK